MCLIKRGSSTVCRFSAKCPLCFPEQCLIAEQRGFRTKNIFGKYPLDLVNSDRKCFLSFSFNLIETIYTILNQIKTILFEHYKQKWSEELFTTLSTMSPLFFMFYCQLYHNFRYRVFLKCLQCPDLFSISNESGLQYCFNVFHLFNICVKCLSTAYKGTLCLMC